MKSEIQRHPDRVSVSFLRPGIVDHDVILTVTLDLRLVADLDDAAVRLLAQEKLQEMSAAVENTARMTTPPEE